MDSKLKDWEKNFPKMQTEIINVKADCASKTTKEEFNVMYTQFPHVATKNDIN